MPHASTSRTIIEERIVTALLIKVVGHVLKFGLGSPAHMYLIVVPSVRSRRLLYSRGLQHDDDQIRQLFETQ